MSSKKKDSHQTRNQRTRALEATRSRKYSSRPMSAPLSLSLSLSLSLLMTCYFSLSSTRNRLSFHARFFFPDDYLKSVVVNKIWYEWTKREFRVFVTFSHGEVTTGSDYYLRCSATCISLFATWWYIIRVKALHIMRKCLTV